LKPFQGQNCDSYLEINIFFDMTPHINYTSNRWTGGRGKNPTNKTKPNKEHLLLPLHSGNYEISYRNTRANT
jgi:hypothetical protein